MLVAQGRYFLWNALEDGCSGTSVNVLECGGCMYGALFRDRCECSAIWGCKRSGGLYLPFRMLSREHIRLARQYCVPSVECIA